MTDHPRRDCRCPRARHQHGTKTAYVVDRCRCTECRAAATAAERERRKLKAYGRYQGLIDAEPARQHVKALQAAGIGLDQITRLGGPSGGVLCKLMYGHPTPNGRRPPSRRIRPSVAAQILAIQPDLNNVADGKRIDATGTRRRAEALIWLGYSKSEIARMLGMAPTNFWKTMEASEVRAATARKVRDLYEQLWDTPAQVDDQHTRISVNRARRYAVEHGYSPPLAWDDEAIDDPAVSPQAVGNQGASVVDEVVVERIAAGAIRIQRWQRSAELVEAVRLLAEAAFSDAAIAERIGRTTATVQKIRARNSIGSRVPTAARWKAA